MENGSIPAYWLFLWLIIFGAIVYGPFFAVYFLSKKLKACEINRTQKAMYRWAIVSAIAIALFWTIWYLVKGQVPVTSAIGNYQLPFAISHWWDILAGPILLPLTIYLRAQLNFYEAVYVKSNVRASKKERTLHMLSEVLFLGIIFGSGMCFIVTMNPTISVSCGLLTGLSASVASICCKCIYQVISLSLCFIFSSATWKKIGKWLAGY